MMMDTETGYVTEESEALCECGCKADDHECGSCRECKIVCEPDIWRWSGGEESVMNERELRKELAKIAVAFDNLGHLLEGFDSDVLSVHQDAESAYGKLRRAVGQDLEYGWISEEEQGIAAEDVR